MPFTRAGQLARSVVTARSEDPIGLVAENLRVAPHGVLPVLDRSIFGEGDPLEREARIVGLIFARDLVKVGQFARLGRAGIGHAGLNPAAANASGFAPIASPFAPPPSPAVAALGNGPVSPASNGAGHLGGLGREGEESTPVALGDLKARDIMNVDVPFVPGIFTLQHALSTLDSYGVDALPVLDESGNYRGLVSRADLIAAMAGAIRPPIVGGMATPLGVFMTDGRLSGGASKFGLFLSGCTIGLIFMLATLIPGFLLSAMKLNSFAKMWYSTAVNADPNVYDANAYLAFHLAATVAQGMVFLGLFRILPISGTHAAEHQTIWALERGLPLEREYIAKMPRAHPRCGTNLMVLSGLILVAIRHLPSPDDASILGVLIFAFFFWRAVGTWVQENFTTRPASPAQLDSGIKAARELMEKYQEQPFAPSAMPLRLLNSGLVYSAAGSFATIWILEQILEFLTKHFSLGG